MPRWKVAVAAAVGLAVLYGAYSLGTKRATNAGDAGWVIDQLGGPPIGMNPRVSPDGRTIAFAAMVRNQTQLAVLTPGTGDWRVLTSDTTQGFVGAPAWSPDGSRIYYSRFTEAPNGVYSITPLGSDERLVLAQSDMPVPLKDGSLLVSRLNSHRRLQLYRYWPQSARLDSLPVSTSHEWGKSFVSAFPDGEEAVFVGAPDAKGEGTAGVYAINLATGATRLLVDAVAAQIALGAGGSFGVSSDGGSVLLPVRVGAGFGVIVVPRDGSGRSTLAFTTTSNINGVDGGPDGFVYVDQIDRDCAWFRYDVNSRLETHNLLTACGNSALPLADGRILETEIGNPTRVVVLKPGALPTRFLEVNQPTSNPAPLGIDRVLVQVGARGDTLVVATASTGQITSRIPWFTDAVNMVGSPDGSTIYFVRAGAVWSIPITGGTPRRIRDGEFVTIDPAGKYLVVAVNAADGVHLYHVPLDDTPESIIPVQKPFRLATIAFGNNAVAPDGRILVTLSPANSWHWQAGILEPRTGHVTVLPLSAEYDLEASWTSDGTIWVVGADIESTLWRYRPAPRPGS